MSRNNLDLIDRKILAELQRDATIPMTKIAECVGLTSTACWRRVKHLEQAGVIEKRTTLLSPASLGLHLSAHVMICTRNHSEQWLRRFTETITALPEVVEFHRTTGHVDYLLKIVAEDLAAYNRIYRTITQLPDLTDVSAALSMETIKITTELPLD